MASTAESTSGDVGRARLLEQLRQRLESVHELTRAMQQHLLAGEAERIEEAGAQLQTVAQEFKILVEEYERLPATAPDEQEAPRTLAARQALEATTTRLARSSAMAGTLLERMVTVGRGLLGLLAGAKDGTYRSDGRGPELDPRGVRLREWV